LVALPGLLPVGKFAELAVEQVVAFLPPFDVLLDDFLLLA